MRDPGPPQSHRKSRVQIRSAKYARADAEIERIVGGQFAQDLERLPRNVRPERSRVLEKPGDALLDLVEGRRRLACGHEGDSSPSWWALPNPYAVRLPSAVGCHPTSRREPARSTLSAKVSRIRDLDNSRTR